MKGRGRGLGRHCERSEAIQCRQEVWIASSPPTGLLAMTVVSRRPTYTSFTFFSGRLRTGLLVAAWMALSTDGITTQIVGSPTPPQKS
jgi:hypothetical protein